MADSVTGLPEATKVKAVSKSAKTDTAMNKQAPTEASTAAVDQVKLTKTVESIEALSTALAEGGFVDHNKVERIKKLIESGEYKIDSDSIAKKLLELEKNLRRRP